MHIAIIGAAGMIGRKLTARLVADGRWRARPSSAARCAAELTCRFLYQRQRRTTGSRTPTANPIQTTCEPCSATTIARLTWSHIRATKQRFPL